VDFPPRSQWSLVAVGHSADTLTPFPVAGKAARDLIFAAMPGLAPGMAFVKLDAPRCSVFDIC
jgi:hypothetical protein